MKKRLVKMAVCLTMTTAILFSVTGCGRRTRNSDRAEDAVVKVGEASESNIEFGDEEGAEAITDFGVRLLQFCLEESANSLPSQASMPQSVYEMSVGERNLLISPSSILSALIMTAGGAGGETLRQMEEVFGMSVPALSAYLSEYQKSLSDNDRYHLNMANAIWLTEDERFTVEQKFLETNENLFGADVYRASFDQSTLKEINEWVKENTSGMIEKILDEISPAAVMYLVNALAFDAEWQEIYHDYQVRDGRFTREDGKVQDVKMMYSEETQYLEGEHGTGFLKYYADGKYAYAAILPEEEMTVAEYAASLTGEELRRMLTNPVETVVQTALPKYESAYEIEMREIFEKMGMTDAFDEGRADFSGIGRSTQGNIFIDRVLHKTFIAVDDRGTKAGAATAVEIKDGCAALEERSKTVYLDRPFLYVIVDCETMIPVFIGVVEDMASIGGLFLFGKPSSHVSIFFGTA
ncbi:serpin family protein [Acetatifactor muris]|uniref:serpin family protein n=1 Tax=Acetatifactor muris TaxID=879566 RepID=UPI0023F4F15A|nr:serpin family protein [Acetatifactor muris]